MDDAQQVPRGKDLRIAVIGAGMSGLYVGYQLKERGIAFTIYEKGADVGGTWRDNTYPGLYVDVVSRSYEFPFKRSSKWSRRYAPGSEVQDYLREVARECGLMPHIRFGVDITSATYRDGRWELESSSGSTVVADVVFAGTGFLREPMIPNFEGRDSFAGPSFHSARWDHSVDLTGKRIGVIGTGSSGVQIVDHLGQRGYDITHFMRNPQWVQVKANPRISWWEHALLRVPALGPYWDRHMEKLKATENGSENWRLVPGPEREERKAKFLADLEREVPDPVLRAKLTPSHELGCKRIPKSATFYRVVQQSNVHPVFGGIERIVPEGVIDTEGTLHELDILVYATGFDSHAYMRPMKVTGVDGVTVEDLWRDGVYSYRAVGLPSMPNFFMLNGPFAPVNSIAVPGSLDDQFGFLIRLLEIIRAEGVAMAPTEAATQRFCHEVADAAAQTTYVQCDNWYRDRGGVPVLWPWTRAKHRLQYERLALEDFDVYPRQQRAAVSSPDAGR